MFKVASAAAVAVGLMSASALTTSALAQSLPKGQYFALQQYTALFDPLNICSGLGLAAGQTGQQEATIAGLGKTYTGVILSTTGAGTTASPYGVTTIGCSFPALPAASAFTKNSDGSYTATPAGADSQVTTCASSKGTFTLSSGNGTELEGLPQTLSITILADPAGSKDSAWRQTATNSDLGGGGQPFLCALSTDAVYVNTVK